MKPKTLTRLLAAGGLGGLAALHWLPERCLPFGSRTASAVMLFGTMLVLHRNPLRLLYKDAKKTLEKSIKQSEQNRPELVADLPLRRGR